MSDQKTRVLQVPEVCTWNPYIELSERHLAQQGVEVLRPGLCLDGPYTAPAAPPAFGTVPDVVHLHWPEILADWYGIDTALGLLRDLKRRGTVVVQTVHDLQPHPFESTPELLAYLHEVDGLTDGAHFFSAEHEERARDDRPRLPAIGTHLLHPAFGTAPASRTIDARDDEVVLGCFGRIRPDKRFVEFARAFGEVAKPGYRLVVAGAPLGDRIDRELVELAAAHPSITYLAGFHSHERFAELVAEVDWVALPYERVFSSGILVNAVEAGKPLLAREPTGADAYQLRQGLLMVEPWDHVTAVLRWMEAAHDPRWRTSPDVLPTWDEAATHLIDFYNRVRA